MSESTDEPFTGGLVHKAFEVQSLRRMYAREEGQAMNERADRWSNCKCGAWFKVLGVSVVGFCPYCGAALSAAAPNNGTYCIHGIKCALCAEGVSPAGTGQPDVLHKDFDDDDHPFRTWWKNHGQFMMSGGGRRESIWAARGFIAGQQLARGLKVTGEVRDSVKGEGETAPPECGVCGAKPGEKGHGADAMGNVHHVPSAPSPEELARDKFAELRSFLTNMRRDAADAEDPELSEYAQAIEQRLDELAALLRARGERWIPVSERYPKHNEKVLVYFAKENSPYLDVFTYSGDNPYFSPLGSHDSTLNVTHWRPLPAPPREGE